MAAKIGYEDSLYDITGLDGNRYRKGERVTLFNSQPPPDDLRRWLKGTAFSVVGILLSAGLCGTSLWLYPDDYVTGMGIVSVIGFVGSVLFFIANLLGVAIRVYRRRR